jgi:hypothetical protein
MILLKQHHVALVLKYEDEEVDGVILFFSCSVCSVPLALLIFPRGDRPPNVRGVIPALEKRGDAFWFSVD